MRLRWAVIAKIEMRFLREPLVHFLILGGAMFGLFAWSGNREDADAGSRRIVIPPGMLKNLSLSFERSNGRVPDSDELDQLVGAYVREEILSREARGLGLDRDDPIIRKRLGDRMEFLTEDSADVAPPTEAQLLEFLGKNADAFARPDGSIPELEEIRPIVERRWLEEKRTEAFDEAYEKLRRKYTVVVEKESAP